MHFRIFKKINFASSKHARFQKALSGGPTLTTFFFVDGTNTTISGLSSAFRWRVDDGPALNDCSFVFSRVRNTDSDLY